MRKSRVVPLIYARQTRPPGIYTIIERNGLLLSLGSSTLSLSPLFLDYREERESCPGIRVAHRYNARSSPDTCHLVLSTVKPSTRVPTPGEIRSSRRCLKTLIALFIVFVVVVVLGSLRNPLSLLGEIAQIVYEGSGTSFFFAARAPSLDWTRIFSASVAAAAALSLSRSGDATILIRRERGCVIIAVKSDDLRGKIYAPGVNRN